MTSAKLTLRHVNAGIALASVICVGLSIYAYSVESAKEADDSYEATCDISERISCTKVFMSEYGKGFGLLLKDSIFNVPNPIYGIIFYSLVAVLGLTNDHIYSMINVTLALSSCIISIYLAYILYVLNSICLICLGTYIFNVIITYLSIKKVRILLSANVANKKKK